MEDYFDGFSEDVTKWEIIREMIDLDLDDEFRNDPNKIDASVQLFRRQDVMLYGTIPKMEQRIYTKCKECKLVFNPRNILSHKTCSGKSTSTTQNLKKKVKSKASSSKKSHSPLPPPPLFKKPTSPPTTVSAAVVAEAKPSTTKVAPKIPKISTVTTTSTHTVTSTTPTKSELRVSSSSSVHSSKSSSVNSPKSPSKSVSSTAHSPKSSTKTVTSTETTASSSTSTSSSSSSSRYKKSRKSNNNLKVTKEFDPDVHCGVVEGNRGPCTRSITCSNHRIQLRKLVPGRSKDIHQLIAERKAAKEKELKHGTASGSYMSPNGSEEKDIFCQNTSYVPIVATIVSTIDSAPTTTYVPIMPKTSNSSSNRQMSTSILATKQLNMTDTENKSSKTLDSGYVTNVNDSSQDSGIGTVPVVYMPMSPISVVSPVQQLNPTDNETKSLKTSDSGYMSNINNDSQDSGLGTFPVVYMPMSPISVVSPVQFVKIGKNMICLESPQSAMSPPLTANQSVFLTIPNQQSNVKMYKSHPKPVALPTYGSKKIGGSILLSNQHVECQRNDILMAINSKQDTLNNTQSYRAMSLLNHTNTPHRPNILKVKSANKVNCKRPAVDKLNTSDSKQLRLGPNVNGFILQSDISETADAPQSNNCIQEKIALLNMK